GLIYEVNVRGFTMLHPDVPAAQRGTIAALAHPAIVAHLRSLRVAAIELMPIVAWIDERHLPPLGLTNAWGYNPVVPMALDPRLAPGGVTELRDTVAALRAAGIGVILDLVFNHTGESDMHGPTLSL
ncbi:glycogen debranching enzyme, partial [Escherichia coli]|nr:glycogen debranching enzyme [Escherichia coli]